MYDPYFYPYCLQCEKELNHFGYTAKRSGIIEFCVMEINWNVYSGLVCDIHELRHYNTAQVVARCIVRGMWVIIGFMLFEILFAEEERILCCWFPLLLLSQIWCIFVILLFSI